MLLVHNTLSPSDASTRVKSTEGGRGCHTFIDHSVHTTIIIASIVVITIIIVVFVVVVVVPITVVDIAMVVQLVMVVVVVMMVRTRVRIHDTGRSTAQRFVQE